MQRLVPEIAPVRAPRRASPTAASRGTDAHHWSLGNHFPTPAGNHAALAALRQRLRAAERDDPLEREAHRVGEAVTASSREGRGAVAPAAAAPVRAATAPPPPALPRRASCEDHRCERDAEEPAEEGVRGAPFRIADAGAVAVEPPPEDPRWSALSGGGRPLPRSIRARWEPDFGTDLGDVRVHTGAAAAALARGLGARAFAYGRHVVFADGAFRPGSESGDRLIAHELAHVVQQRGSRPVGVQRDEDPTAPPPPSPRGRLRLADRTFTGCDDDQNFHVDFALLRVPVWINSVIADLEDYRTRPREIITVTESALHRFFHPPGTRLPGTTIGVIRRRLERMRDVLLAAGGIRCVTERGCRARFRDALAFAGPSTPVSLCPSFFGQSLNDQVSTLIHEAAHRVGLMRNVIDRDAVAALPLHQAMNNAESYALLVTEVFWGPPAAPGPPPPVPLTPAWSASHMSSAIELEAPRRGTFREGRGARHLLSDEQRSFVAPFPSSQPFRFRGRVRYFLDSRETPLPGGTPMPTVRAQVLFIPGSERTVPMFMHDDPAPVYAGPGLPLVVGFDTRFDFTMTDNGNLRFTLWLEVTGPEGPDMAAMFDDTVQVQPQNDI